MKIAYLITAYIDPLHLRRLCDAILYDTEVDSTSAYIHVDKKVDEKLFRNVVEGVRNIHFCENRFYINWGGYNQVLAQRELLRCAIESGKDFDRFVCISATDYPLWSNKRIVSFYKENLKKQLIGGYDITASPNNWQKQKVIYYHYFRDLPVPVCVRRVFSFGSRMMLRYLGIKRTPVVKFQDGSEGHIFTGSDYWSLTRDCAEDVYRYLQDDSPFVKRLKDTYIPSELVINTIVYNSRFRLYAYPFCPVTEGTPDPGLDQLTPLHCIDYNGSIKVWTEVDYERLVASNKMFCRKTLSGISDALIERIEKELR